MKAFYYFFYKIYLFWENGPIRFWSHFKTGLTIVFLEIWLVLSLFIYYNVFIDRYFHLDRTLFLTISTIIIAINVCFFSNSADKWVLYKESFDKIATRKNLIGGIIVWSIVGLIALNLVVAFYVMGKIDWNKYR